MSQQKSNKVKNILKKNIYRSKYTQILDKKLQNRPKLFKIDPGSYRSLPGPNPGQQAMASPENKVESDLIQYVIKFIFTEQGKALKLCLLSS